MIWHRENRGKRCLNWPKAWQWNSHDFNLLCCYQEKLTLLLWVKFAHMYWIHFGPKDQLLLHKYINNFNILRQLQEETLFEMKNCCKLKQWCDVLEPDNRRNTVAEKIIWWVEFQKKNKAKGLFWTLHSENKFIWTWS